MSPPADGPGQAGPAARVALRAVAAVLAAYVVGFFAFYPDAITNTDEAGYIRHAQSIAEGRLVHELLNPVSGEIDEVVPFRPVGTALLLAPFVWAFGWQGAYLGPLLLLLVATGATALLLRRLGYSPLFALVLPAFPAGLVLGRVPSSDLAAAALTAVGLLAFFRGGAAGFALAGLLAGMSPAIRETAPLVFAPLFAGAVLRRDARAWVLVLAGAVGLGVPGLFSQLMRGDALFLRSGLGYTFALEHVPEGLLFYGLLLVVLVPGGLVATALARGPRWPECALAVAGFVLFHAAYGYTGSESGLARRLVVGGRFMLPILPLIALQLADLVPRALELLGRSRPRLVGQVPHLVRAGVALLALGCFGVHPAFSQFSGSLGELQRLIYETTDPSVPIVTDAHSSAKFISGVLGPRGIAPKAYLNPAVAGYVLDRHGAFFLLLIERDDSDHWRRRARRNAEFVQALRAYQLELRVDHTAPSGERLRIWRVSPRDADRLERGAAVDGAAARRAQRRSRRYDASPERARSPAREPDLEGDFDGEEDSDGP